MSIVCEGSDGQTERLLEDVMLGGGVNKNGLRFTRQTLEGALGPSCIIWYYHPGGD